MADAPAMTIRRRVLVIVAVAIAVLLGAEVAARLLSPRLPEPQRFQSIEAQQKVDEMDRRSRLDGADIVFVGNSLVNVAIDPAIVERGLGSNLEVYNAALSAGVPPIMEPWTLSVVLPRLRPKVVVIGVFSFDFYDYKSGPAFREAFANSPGGKQALGKEGLLERTDRVLRASRLWEYRQSMRDPRAVARAALGKKPKPQVGEVGPVTKNGRTAALNKRPQGRRGRATIPVEDWSLGDRTQAALRRLITGIQRTGASVIVVDMPVTSLYVADHPHGEADYNSYLDAARRLTGELGVPFLEVPFSRSPDLFFDQVHLLAQPGDTFTEQLTARLAEEPAVQKVRTGSR